MRGCCAALGCKSYAIWLDVDTGREFCGAHSIIELMRMDDDAKDRRERRKDIGDEWARDAARGEP